MNNIREEQLAYRQQFEAIEAPERIFSLLKPAIGNDASLKIIADNGDEIFRTTLLNIDYGRRLLTVRKIKYTFGHLMVIDAKRLTIYSQHDGAEISFTSYLSRYSERNDGFYEIPFPATLKYCQRRMSHRVHISFSMEIVAAFVNERGEKVYGYLRDISAEGLRLQLIKVNPDQFKESALIKNCVISLPNRENMSCTFQIIHKQNHVRNNGCTIGGAFIDMSVEQKKEIQKFIVGVERRSLREMRL
jgi:c-di-GMP-binding flagellar brake protein YcgR